MKKEPMKKTTSMYIIGKTKKGFSNDYEVAEKIGLTRQALSRKLLNPSTFKPTELVAMANFFEWSDEELGAFVRAI